MAGSSISIKKADKPRPIVNYSSAGASKDAYNRKRGLTRLEKQVKPGKLTKANINNKGYNKYLKMDGGVIEIDYNKYVNDAVWDGLKGYVTNAKPSNNEEIMGNDKNLWHIEKASRISKTDLRIRPIYYRPRNRFEAHTCIAFTAYCIYKELERAIYREISNLSFEKATGITHNMYQTTYTLPGSKHTKSRLPNMDR